MGKTKITPIHGLRHACESETAENFMSRGPYEKTGPDSGHQEFAQPHLTHSARFQNMEGGPAYFDEGMSARTI